MPQSATSQTPGGKRGQGVCCGSAWRWILGAGAAWSRTEMGLRPSLVFLVYEGEECKALGLLLDLDGVLAFRQGAVVAHICRAGHCGEERHLRNRHLYLLFCGFLSRGS